MKNVSNQLDIKQNILMRKLSTVNEKEEEAIL